MKITLRRAMPATLLLIGITATLLTTGTAAEARPLAFRSTVALPAIEKPTDIAVNNRNKLVYLADQKNSTVTVVHPLYNSIVRTPIAVPSGVNKLAINSNTNELAVSSTDGYEISIIDLSTRAISTIVTTHKVTEMAFNTVKNELWFSGLDASLVSVIDMNASPRAVSATLNAGRWPQRLAIDEKADRVYVNNNSGSTISSINGATKTPEGTVVTSTGAFGDLAVDSETHQVYVTEYLYRQGTLAVFDGQTGVFSKRNAYPSGKAVMAFLDVAFDQVTKKFFTIDTTNRLLSWDAATNTFESFGFEGSVSSVAVDQVNGEVSVLGKQPHTLTGSYLMLHEQGPLAPEITSGDPPTATVFERYGFVVTSTSFLPESYQVSYRITSGSLPWGLDLDPDTGVIHGTPMPSFGPLVWNFTVTATNAFGSTNANYKIALAAP